MLTLQQITEQYPAVLKPFKRDMLREYLQYKILEIIFTSEYAAKLSFLGGTALRIVYGNTRFSEDLDFDNFALDEKEFDGLAQKVRAGLEVQGLKVEVGTVAKGAYRCRVRLPDILFINELSPHQEEKILIQIDSAAHHFQYKPDKKILNKFDVFSEIFVTPPDLLLSQKINAAVNRKRAKGRDFYDIVFLFSFTGPNYDYLREKLDISNKVELREFFSKNLPSFDFNELGRDVRSFLFNPADARKVELFPQFINQALL
jgi:predicted nucleotidyltransferase component of viral defense system